MTTGDQPVVKKSFTPRTNNKMNISKNTPEKEIQYLRAQVASLTADAVRNGKLLKKARKLVFENKCGDVDFIKFMWKKEIDQ